MFETEPVHLFYDRVYIPPLDQLVYKWESLPSDVRYHVKSCVRAPSGKCQVDRHGDIQLNDNPEGFFVERLDPGTVYTFAFSVQCAGTEYTEEKSFKTSKNQFKCFIVFKSTAVT